MPHAIIPFLPAISSGLGTLGSFLGSRKKTTTTTPTLSPELQAMMDKNSSFLSGVRDDPGGGLEPIKRAAMDSVNRNYAKLPLIATAKMAQRGFGASGKIGDAVFDTEGARLSDLSGINSKFAEMTSNRQMTAAQILQQMINASRGQSQTAPGNVAGNGLTTASNGLENLSLLSTLAKMLSNGGGGATTGLPASTRNPADSFDLSGLFSASTGGGEFTVGDGWEG